MTEIMVRQWSFCEHCRGRGCPECKGTGKTVALIRLDSLPKGSSLDGVRAEYVEMQKDFIIGEIKELGLVSGCGVAQFLKQGKRRKINAVQKLMKGG